MSVALVISSAAWPVYSWEYIFPLAPYKLSNLILDQGTVY